MAKSKKKSPRKRSHAGSKGVSRPTPAQRAPTTRRSSSSAPAARSRTPLPADILAYNAAQSAGDKRICDALAAAIERHLTETAAASAERKIWHRHPVWFLDGNPIVGYHKLKDCIRLLFWSGQSFDEPGLAPEGTFKAAEARYTSESQISVGGLKRWLEKSIAIQWDYKNIVKRRGRLERLK